MLRGRGTALVVLSAVGFGFMPLFGAWARAGGSGTDTMLFLRFLIAGGLLGAWSLWRRQRLPRGRMLATLLVMGGALQTGESWCYFKAIEVFDESGGASPALAALLLYTYPAIVAIGSRVFLGVRLAPSRIAAVALAMAGTALAVWGPIERPPIGGVTLGLLAAACYAAYILLGSRLQDEVPSVMQATIVMLSAAAALGVLTFVSGSPAPRAPIGWGGVLALALVSTIMSLTLFLAGLRLVGPVRASILSSLEALTAVIVAWVFLGEPLRPIQAVGGVMILLAAGWTARSQAMRETRPITIRTELHAPG